MDTPMPAFATSQAATFPESFPSERRWRILVVDDEPANLQVLRGILEKSYHLAFAKSGPLALEAARRHSPDLILLDIMMPEMDGYEVCRRLKQDQALAGIPVIFVTAMGEFEDEARGFAAGAVDYIIKPVSAPIVMARVRSQICLNWSLKQIQRQADHLEIMVAERTRALEEEFAERQRTHRTLSTVLDASPVAIVTLDPNGRVGSWNRAAETIFGYRAEEIIGAPFPRALDDGLPLNRLLEHLAAGEAIRSAERIRERRDGSPVHLRGSAAGLFDREEFQGAVVVAEDVTELKRAEEQFRQAQKMEAVGNLTGGIAHDFNNLLTVILCNLDLAAKLPCLDPQAQDFCQGALGAALRGAELTRQLLAFSRRQALHPERVDLNALVNSMVKLLSRTLGGNVDIVLSEGKELWPVVVDPAQLDSAILNLAVNARDAMPTGGRLTICTGNRTIERPTFDGKFELAVGDYVVIEITDAGTGMPPEVAARIFEPFFTTKGPGKGTGLGLAMVYGFVKQSGGHVSVYSELGHGTTFRLYLPRAEREADATIAAEDEASPSHTGGTILAVEDNPFVRKVVVHMLTQLGYQVVTAGTAGEAIEVLERGDDVALVFSDIVMPGDMSGIELALEVRRRWPQIKVALTSGFSEEALSNDGIVTDFTIISKPYREQDLARKISALLSG